MYDGYVVFILIYAEDPHFKSNFFIPKKEGYLVSGAIISGIYIVCCLITFFGTKELKGGRLRIAKFLVVEINLI